MKYDNTILRELLSKAVKSKPTTKRDEVKLELKQILALRKLGVSWEFLAKDINERFALGSSEQFTPHALSRFASNARARGQVKESEVHALSRELGAGRGGKRKKTTAKAVGAVKPVSKGVSSQDASKPAVVAPVASPAPAPVAPAAYRPAFGATNGVQGVK